MDTSDRTDPESGTTSDSTRRDASAGWDGDVAEQNPPLPDYGASDGDQEGADTALVGTGASISPDTHVGSNEPVEHPDVEPSEPRPEALVEGNRVGDGRDLEVKDDEDTVSDDLVDGDEPRRKDEPSGEDEPREGTVMR